MSLAEDPITREQRLVAPGRSARLGPRPHGCPFCPGNEHTTPPQTGSIAARDHVDDIADWSARSFPNLFPLTDPHEVLVPTPRHATSWRDLTLPELQAGLELLLERHAALQADGCYVHTFVNDGTAAGASLPHVHAQLVVVPDAGHAERLTAGVLAGDCALCALLEDHASPLMVERGNYYSIVAHPVPRMGGGLLLIPNTHDDVVGNEPAPELAALLHRALRALPDDTAMNFWLVANRRRGAHWYLELQPRTANLAGVELALGLSVIAQDPIDVAEQARERLAMHS